MQLKELHECTSIQSTMQAYLNRYTKWCISKLKTYEQNLTRTYTRTSKNRTHVEKCEQHVAQLITEAHVGTW